MQVEKCYFLSNLPRQAVSNPESGRESKHVSGRNSLFLWVQVFTDGGLRTQASALASSVAVYTFGAVIYHSKGKACPILLNLPLYRGRTSGMR